MQQRPNVIVAQSDPVSAARLVSELHPHCKKVYVAQTPEEVCTAVPRQRADVVIVDLEMLPLPEVERLHHQFGNVSIVTTHRVADEEMWARSLQAGAIDCFYPQDVRGIVGSALGNLRLVRSRAA